MGSPDRSARSAGLDPARAPRDATALEQSLLVSALRAPAAGVGVEQIVARLPDRPAASAVAAGFERAARRFPALSAYLAWDGLAVPERRVATPGEAAIPFERFDWSGRSREDAERLFEAWLAEDRGRGFRLDAPPLLRVAWFDVAGEVRVVWTFHHLIADGRSFEPVLALALDPDTSAAGAEEANGAQRPVPFEVDAAREFWTRELEGFEGPTPLPHSVARELPEASEAPPGESRRVLGEETSRRLASLASRAGVPPSTVAAAAWAILLARASGEDDVVFGRVSSGRQAADAGRVGLFIRTSPQRVRVPRGGPVLPWLADLRASQVAARRHEAAPLPDIASWLGRPGDRPLFSTLLVFDHEELGDRLARRGGVWASRSFRLVEKTGEALTLYATAGVGGGAGEAKWTVALAWDRSRFDDAAGERTAEALAALFTSLARKAPESLDFADLALVSEEERSRVLFEWNETEREVPGAGGTADLAIAEAARRDSSATAIVCGDERVSRGELQARARSVAEALAAAGVRPGDAVGVCTGRSAAMLAGLLGVWKAGAAYVPLDPDYPAERLELIAGDAGVSAVLVSDATRDRLPEGLVPGLSLEAAPATDDADDADEADEADEQGADPFPSPHRSPDSLAYVLYTSGSTGRPKGVEVTHANVLNFFAGMDAVLGDDLPADPAWLALTSISFDISVLELFWTLARGIRVVLPPAPTRELSLLAPRSSGAPHLSIPWLLERHAVTHVQSTPTLARMLVAEEESRSALARLDAFVVGGEALAADLARSLVEAGPRRVWNMYGPTETTVWSTAAPVSIGPTPSIGRPLANTRAYVLDAAGQPLPPLFPGELWIGGAGVARGYRHLVAETGERFRPDPFAGPHARMYRTGDRARWTEEGSLEFLGRADEQVKIRGHRVEPGEVEAALRRHDGVDEAVVAAREIDGERRLVAWVATARGTDAAPTEEELGEALAAELPEALRPSRYVILPALPRTPNGKLDRRSLPLPPPSPSPSSASDGRRRAAREPAEPADPLEAELARIWCEVLRLDSVGVEESFFELGGHSLKAIQLVSLVSRRCRVDVPLETLFDASSVRAFAAAVRRISRTPAPPPPPPRALRAEPRERFEPFALTETQQAYWIGRGDGFELGNVSTHSYVEIDVPHLDLARAQAALDRLIARHDMLRVRILPDGRQQVLETVPPYRIEVLDLRGLDEDEAEEQLERTRARLSGQTIPSGRWPLFDVRATLLEGCVRIHLTVDHLAVDALSWRTLRRELLHAYRRPEVPLPELAYTFREYVEERAEARTEEHGRARAYWEARLPSLPPAPELPYARSFAEVRRPRMRRRRAHLSAVAWRRLRARARRTGVTGTAALLASFADALAAWSRAPRMTLNVPTFRRRPVHPQVNEVVGVFTSLTLLEVDAGTGSFEERARRIQRRLWEDLDHGEFSGVEAIRELGRARGASGAALLPVVFTSLLFAGDSAPRDRTAATEPSAEIVYDVNQAPQVSLSAEVAEERGGLSYRLDAVDELFPPGLLDDFLGAWGAHLEALARDASAWARGPVETAEALLPGWQAARRRAANATEAPLSELRLEELFDAALERGLGGRTAVVTGGREMTYEELDRRAAALARRLAGLGVERGDLVAIAMEKGWEQAAAVLAILRAGAAYLPVEPELPPERLRYLLGNGDVRVALTTSAVRDRFAFGDGVVAVDADREPPAGDGEPRATRGERSPDDLAYVLYTSGSTGLPKGVAITHRGAVNTVLDVNERFGVGSDDRIFGISALGFDLSVWDLFGAFAAGGAVVLPAESAVRDPAQWLEPIVEGRVTIWDSVPALLKLFLETASERLAGSAAARRVRLVLLSGDWTPVSLPAEIATTLPRARIVSLGGATEASIWSIAFPIERVDPSWRSIPYGLPMRNQRFHVLDGGLAPRPVWVPGHLFIGGAGLAAGYLGDPEKTRASFFPHPRTGERLYRTGDLGRYLPDGNIEFLGRDDHQVKVLGTRIELGEIEAALGSHPGVASAVATTRGEWNRHVHAYFVPRPGASPSAAELRAHLEAKLPPPMIPEAFVRLSSLPLTANGKVDRTALPLPVDARDSGESPRAARATESGDPLRAVAAAVAAILHLRALEPEDNLIDLGANSVDFIRIANLVEKTTGVRPPLHEIYREPTVAAIVRSAGAGASASASASVDSVPLVPLSRLQAREEAWEEAE